MHWVISDCCMAEQSPHPPLSMHGVISDWRIPAWQNKALILAEAIWTSAWHHVDICEQVLDTVESADKREHRLDEPPCRWYSWHTRIITQRGKCRFHTTNLLPLRQRLSARWYDDCIYSRYEIIKEHILTLPTVTIFSVLCCVFLNLL